jgi:hypothetical protein
MSGRGQTCSDYCNRGTTVTAALFRKKRSVPRSLDHQKSLFFEVKLSLIVQLQEVN